MDYSKEQGMFYFSLRLEGKIFSFHFKFAVNLPKLAIDAILHMLVDREVSFSNGKQCTVHQASFILCRV